MPPVIQVSNLSKSYRLGVIGGGTLREDVSRWWAKFRGQPDPTLKIGQEHHVQLKGQDFWALQDVSFEVQQGAILGIIGRNGAGKSTLLKILSRVTAPTSGEVRVKGRIASLLEVGTGFHPELTGRENIFLNGAILGMTKGEIRRKFDEIVAFAEIDQFIDTPVKRYSSGMYVRLAFAVAAHLDPHILIVDEVLAVGDVEFQRKCLGKMGDVACGGRTILFVSHNMQAVRQLCGRAAWLSDGRVVMHAPAAEVVEAYVHDAQDSGWAYDVDRVIRELPHDPAFRLNRIAVLQDGARRTDVVSGKAVVIRIEYDVFHETSGLHVTFELHDREGTLLFESLSNGDRDDLPVVQPGRYVSEALIPADFLSPTDYEIHVKAGVANVRSCYPGSIRLAFNVIAAGRVNRAYPGYRTPGKIAPLIEWNTRSS